MRRTIPDGRNNIKTIFTKGRFQTNRHRLFEHGSRACAGKNMAVYLSLRRFRSRDAASLGHVTALARRALLCRPALLPVAIYVGTGDGG
jgi:hypothetical protein